MKPTVKNIYDKIDEYSPFSYALDWDNSGLLVGGFEREATRIHVALDADDDVIEKAILDHADLIVTHHPLIFRGIKSVTDEDFIGRRLLKLAENGVSMIAAHTNYDVAVMSDIVASKYRLQNIRPLEVTGESNGKAIGIGAVGEVEKTELKAIVFSTKIGFDLDAVRVFGDNRAVNRIAICPGSGGSDIDLAVKSGADVYITGDVSHHEGIDAVAKGIAVIDAGHWGLEHVFVEDMTAMLRVAFPAAYVEGHGKSSPFETV